MSHTPSRSPLRRMNAPLAASAFPSNADALERSALVQAWARGWALSRGVPAPHARGDHLRIDVGLPGHVTRYLLPHLDRDLLARLVSTQARSGTWLKICASPTEVTPLLPPGWRVHEPEFLMGTVLVDRDIPQVEGYRARIELALPLLRAEFIAAAGEVAASGQAAVDGAFAIFDQIVTADAHRRRGLGRAVMAALTRGARDRGARQGVLVATEAGAALYQALGWSMVSPVTAASLVESGPGSRRSCRSMNRAPDRL